MIDWNKKFKAEYAGARGWLRKQELFSKDWHPLVKRLHSLMGELGFGAGDAAALAELRDKVSKGSDGKRVTEDQGLLEAVGAWAGDGAVAVDDGAKMRAAALKLLRHVYLLSKSGNRMVWVVSLPKDFREWPSDDLHARASSRNAARALLMSNAEIFSEEQKKHLGSATFHALAWCQRAAALLAVAAIAANGTGNEANKTSLDVVRRWFAQPGLPMNELKTHIATLQRGFRSIIDMLGRGRFVLTDWVPLRGATIPNEVKWLNSEAFTFPSNAEGMDVVYIERSFFVDHPANVLKGQRNWIRILVHELSHLACGTQDVTAGDIRYAWYGIGPHTGFPGSAAICNADSWAFFCADAAGALTEGERAMALKIV